MTQIDIARLAEAMGATPEEVAEVTEETIFEKLSDGQELMNTQREAISALHDQHQETSMQLVTLARDLRKVAQGVELVLADENISAEDKATAMRTTATTLTEIGDSIASEKVITQLVAEGKLPDPDADPLTALLEAVFGSGATDATGEVAASESGEGPEITVHTFDSSEEMFSFLGSLRTGEENDETATADGVAPAQDGSQN